MFWCGSPTHGMYEVTTAQLLGPKLSKLGPIHSPQADLQAYSH